MYVLNDTYTYTIEDAVIRNDKLETIMYDNFTFLNVSIDDINEAKFKKYANESETLYLSLEIGDNFLENTSITDVNILDNQVDVIMTFDDKHMLQNCKYVFLGERNNTNYKSIVNIETIEYGEQTLSFPTDLVDDITATK